jgi:hypothetical protein
MLLFGTNKIQEHWCSAPIVEALWMEEVSQAEVTNKKFTSIEL